MVAGLKGVGIRNELLVWILVRFEVEVRVLILVLIGPWPGLLAVRILVGCLVLVLVLDWLR